MKIKLTEAAKPFSKYRKKFEQNIIPALEDMGYHFQLSRTQEPNVYSAIYKGIVTDRNDIQSPFTLTVNTTQRGLEPDQDVFATLNAGLQLIQIGGINVNEPMAAQDFFDFAVPDTTDLEISEPVYDGRSKSLPSPDGKTVHTKEEWMTLLKRNQDTMTPNRFASWYNDEFPLELAKDIENVG